MMKQVNINKTFLIILLGILAALGPFTIDMYLPGFGRIAADLGTDEKHVAFTLTSYFIGIAVGQLIYGPIVDKYGRKRPLIIGLGIYALASIGCAIVPNIETMMALRLIQALGGCVGMVATNAIISDVYDKDKRAKAFSSIMLVMGVAPLIAPSIGSLLLEKADWYYIFYFLAGFSSLVLLMIVFFLPETAQFMHQKKLRIRHVSQEYFGILKNRTFLLYTLSGSLVMSILFAYITSSSYVFLTLYGLDKTTFSLLFSINASGLIIGSSLNGVMTKYFNYIKIADVAAFVLSLFSVVVLGILWTSGVLPYPYLVVFIFTILFLVGFINPNMIAASLAPFTHNTGAASALGGAMRMGVGAIVAAFIGVFQGESANVMFVTMSFLAVSSWVLLRMAKSRSVE